MDDSLIARLAAVLAHRAPGEFHFPEIYGPDWGGLWIGDKVRLGREFLDLVRKGRFAGVSDTGRKQGRGRIYRLGQASCVSVSTARTSVR